MAGAWASTMWWLCAVDGPVPLGDIIYAGGVLVSFLIDSAPVLTTIGPAVYDYADYIAEDAANTYNKVSDWLKEIAGNSNIPKFDPDDFDKGFKNFRRLKKYLGKAGNGQQWHHIVEQSQIKKSGFDTYDINNVKNVINIPDYIHKQISAIYSSNINVDGTTLRLRDWLAGQSMDAQYEYGINLIKEFGDVVIENGVLALKPF